MIPLEVSVWNTAIGEYSQRLGLKDGMVLTFPVIEHRHKRPDLGYPLLNEFHIYSLGLATPEQLRIINRLSSKANVVLRSFFERRGLKLNRLVLEFGTLEGQVVVAGEISPRTSSITEMQVHAKTARSRSTNRRNALPRRSNEELLLEIRNRVCRTGSQEN